MAEATLLPERHGVAPQVFSTGVWTLLSAAGLSELRAKIVQAEYSPGFQMSLGLKDLLPCIGGGRARRQALRCWTRGPPEPRRCKLPSRQ